ncbi:MAG: precorrin-2 C(20)-methyltransferase [Hyphomicrobiales bacterium]|nr:precorrin-2 C(20)-methyltransferase [Hyphomicrobiales bacterium]
MIEKGVLYGVGVGPGDPELLTVKGARLISEANLIAFPIDKEGAALARKIAAPYIPQGAEELPVPIFKRGSEGAALDAYEAAISAISARLDKGDDVVFLCAGDPFFYGSFIYVFARLARRHRIEVIPGVTSLTAAAARLRQPLAARDDVIKVLPGTLDDEQLRAELGRAKSVAIIKVGRHFDRLRALLRVLGLDEKASVVESATLAEERIYPLSEVPEGARPYFSMILIYSGSPSW